MLESLRNKKVLLVVAHPDDEILGSGATMHRLINDFNCKVRVVILGEGLTSRSHTRNMKKWDEKMKIHRSNIQTSKQIIGFDSIKLYDFPDNRFDSIDIIDLIKVIENEKTQYEAEVIFTHHGGDVNIDHQRTFEAVITAVRPLEEEKIKTVLTFETMSGTEWRASSDPKHFIPNMFVEVSEENLNAKCKAMESYEFEKRNFPHPRSPKALNIRAQMWGISNGVKYAEAFQLIRSIEKI